MYIYKQDDPKLQPCAYVKYLERDLYEVIEHDEDAGMVTIENCRTGSRDKTTAFRVATQFKLVRAAPTTAPATVEEGLATV